MAKLGTTWLGLHLEHPIVPGASPLADNIDTVLQLEDHGAPMIVLRSLFEEQLTREQLGTYDDMEGHAESYGEATSYFPSPANVRMGPDAYLDQIRLIRERVAVPVVASLNGATPGGWLEYATLIQQAGAHALELNFFDLPTDTDETGADVEQRLCDAMIAVRSAVNIPVAVKLSPFFSSIPHIVTRLGASGATGVILFNRFYQPDINVETLEAEPTLRLSDPSELLLRLRWLAILHGRVEVNLAASGGVHTQEDVVKALMAGAHCVQVVSALLHHGPSMIGVLKSALDEWLDEHEYEHLAELVGCMSLLKCPDPQAFTRGNYMRMLHGWRSS